MDWLPPSWLYWRVPGTGAARLSAVDLWLVQVAYEVVAAESMCTRCDSLLGDRISLVPADFPSDLVSVTVRCRGWRRHLHRATVRESANDLLLGPLRAG
jgi:hypothetical protein